MRKRQPAGIFRGQYDARLLRDLADKRYRAHVGQDNQNALSYDAELVGICGEAAVAQYLELELDTSVRRAGMGAANFTTRAGTIDVLTAKRAARLLRRANREYADILVLCAYDPEETWARVVGWQYDSEMVKCPVVSMGYGIESHAMRAKFLRKPEELRDLVSPPLRQVALF